MTPCTGIADTVRDVSARLARGLVPYAAAAALGAFVLFAPAPAQASEGTGLLQGIAGAAAQTVDAADDAADDAEVSSSDGAVSTVTEAEEPASDASEGAEAAEEAASTDDASSVADGMVQESGIAFEVADGVYFAEDGWWTYLTETEALYFRIVAQVAGAPDVTLDAPDDEWVQAMTGDGYTYLGAVAYDGGGTPFYAYFFYDGEAYIDFCAFVPLADGSVTAVDGFFRGDDLDAMLGMIDEMLQTVVPVFESAADGVAVEAVDADHGTSVSGQEVVSGAFSFTLPDGVDFELTEEEGGTLYGTFSGPVGTCQLMVYSFSTDDMVISSTDELQAVGDAFMSGVGEGAGLSDGQVLDGFVFTNDQGVAYYQACYISNSLDATFALLSHDDTMTVVSIFDGGSTDDFAYANEMLFTLVDTAVLVGFAEDSAGSVTSSDASASDGSSLASLVDEGTQLV